MNITIHIGYPKSASTTIQKHLSQLSEKTLYLGKNSQTSDSKKIVQILNFVIAMEEMTFIYRLREFQTVLNNILNNYTHIFISEEQLIGGNDVWLIGYRLKRLFHNKNIKILIITRKYRDIIKSDILDKKLFFLPANKYLNATLDFNLKKPYNSMLKKYFYFDTYRTYINLFGKNNIKLIPFELLKENKVMFITEMYSFMDVDNPIIPKNNNTQAHASGVLRSLRREYSKLRRYVLKDVSLKKILKVDSSELLSKIENTNGYNRLMKLRSKKISLNEENINKINELYQNDYNSMIENGFNYFEEYDYLKN